MPGGGRSRHQTFLQRTAIWIPVGVVGLLMLPLAVTTRTFGDDWTKHLWMVRQQELNIQANGRPGLFLSANPLGAFYPIFGFVGSGLYTVGAYVALILGDRPILAYKLLYLAALGLAYGGMTWLSWQVGLRAWRAQIPGLVFVTGAYFVTDMFARGDLGELAAISAIPFLIAAVTAVTISSRLRPVHLLGVVVGVFVLTGSHNITLLYGTIFLALLGLVVLGAYQRSGLALLPWRRLPALIAAFVIGTGLNAWYLLVDLKYGLSTDVARQNRAFGVSSNFAKFGLLLDPLRPADPSVANYTHDMRIGLPWLFAAWALVVAVVVWRRVDAVGRRLIVLLTVLVALYIALLPLTAWRYFPHSFSNIQYTWRLHAYVLLGTALLVMVVLVAHAREAEPTRRATSAVLAAIVVFTVGAATWQAWVVPSTYHQYQRELRAPADLADIVVTDRHVRPRSWGGGGDFRVLRKPVVDLGYARQLVVPEAEVVGSRFRGSLAAPPGPEPFRTNISAGAPLVEITGIKPVGYTTSGFVVAEREPGAAQTGPVHVTIRAASTGLPRAGAVVSMLSLGALAGLLAWAIGAGLWTRLSAFAAARRVPLASGRPVGRTGSPNDQPHDWGGGR